MSNTTVESGFLSIITNLSSSVSYRSCDSRVPLRNDGSGAYKPILKKTRQREYEMEFMRN